MQTQRTLGLVLLCVAASFSTSYLAHDIPQKPEEYLFVRSCFGEKVSVQELAQLQGVWQEYLAYSETELAGLAGDPEDRRLDMPTPGEATFHVRLTRAGDDFEFSIGTIQWDGRQSKFLTKTHNVKIRQFNSKLLFFTEIGGRHLISMGKVSDANDQIEIYFPNKKMISESPELNDLYDEASSTLDRFAFKNFKGNLFNENASYAIKRYEILLPGVNANAE